MASVDFDHGRAGEPSAPQPWFIRQAREGRFDAVETPPPDRTALPVMRDIDDPGPEPLPAGLPMPAAVEAAPDAMRPSAIQPSSMALAPGARSSKRAWLAPGMAAGLVLAALAGWVARGVDSTPLSDAPAASTRDAGTWIAALPTTGAPPVPAAATPPVPAIAVTPRPVPEARRLDDRSAIAAPVPFAAQPDKAAVAVTETRASPSPASSIRPAGRAASPAPRRAVAAANPCAAAYSRGARLVCASADLRAREARLARYVARISAAASGDADALKRLAKGGARFVARRDRCRTRACVLDKIKDRFENVARVERRINKRLRRTSR